MINKKVPLYKIKFCYHTSWQQIASCQLTFFTKFDIGLANKYFLNVRDGNVIGFDRHDPVINFFACNALQQRGRHSLKFSSSISIKKLFGLTALPQHCAYLVELGTILLGKLTDVGQWLGQKSAPIYE